MAPPDSVRAGHEHAPQPVSLSLPAPYERRRSRAVAHLQLYGGTRRCPAPGTSRRVTAAGAARPKTPPRAATTPGPADSQRGGNTRRARCPPPPRRWAAEPGGGSDFSTGRARIPPAGIAASSVPRSAAPAPPPRQPPGPFLHGETSLRAPRLSCPRPDLLPLLPTLTEVQQLLDGERGGGEAGKLLHLLRQPAAAAAGIGPCQRSGAAEGDPGGLHRCRGGGCLAGKRSLLEPVICGTATVPSLVAAASRGASIYNRVGAGLRQATPPGPLVTALAAFPCPARPGPAGTSPAARGAPGVLGGGCGAGAHGAAGAARGDLVHRVPPAVTLCTGQAGRGWQGGRAQLRGRCAARAPHGLRSAPCGLCTHTRWAPRLGASRARRHGPAERRDGAGRLCVCTHTGVLAVLVLTG